MESLGSSGSELLLYSDYKLALKHFINKDFEKSFVITSKVYNAAVRSFEKGQVREKTFVKIVSLYLTEIGILLPAHSTVLAHDRASIVQDLQNDVLLRELHAFYGNTSSIPGELLYQIFLVYYTCSGLIGESIVDKFKLTYHNLETEIGDLGDVDDVYFQRWIELFIFNVLPDSANFDMAHAILDNVFPNNTSAKSKLQQIESRKADEAKLAQENKNKAKKAEADRLAQQKAKELQQAQEKDLKYMSIKQIRNKHESETTGRETSEAKEDKVAVLLQKVQYYYELIKRTIGANSPMIILMLVSLLVATKFLRARKYNLREKFKETMAMAFKVTYL